MFILENANKYTFSNNFFFIFLFYIEKKNFFSVF